MLFRSSYGRGRSFCLLFFVFRHFVIPEPGPASRASIPLYRPAGIDVLTDESVCPTLLRTCVLWGRRFRLPTDYFSRSQGAVAGTLPARRKVDIDGFLTPDSARIRLVFFT